MFVRVESVSELAGLAPATRIKVNGREHTVEDYDGLVVAGTPLLEVLAVLGHSVEVERS